MIKRNTFSACFSIIVLLFTFFGFQTVKAQDAGLNVKGIVLESGTGLPLKQVTISVTATGTTAGTDENGAFSISVPNNQVELVIYLPGYNKRNIFLNGRESLTISLVSSDFTSFDNTYNDPLGEYILKNATYSLSKLSANELANTSSTSFDQVLKGRVSGLSSIEQSGMPGSKNFLNIRGFSSLFGKTEPLLVIDGMIHEYSYANNSLMEGFSINPFDIIDIEDISDVTVMKDGASYLGAAGSNGIINVNTEQKGETSTVIKLSAYEGMSFAPQNLDMMDADQYRGYFTDMLAGQVSDGQLTPTQIAAKYPWLNGNTSSKDFYRYNNNTDWQSEIFKPANLQKYYFFLKGGDDIATYNVSTSLTNQKGILDGTSYSRFNLRVNGKINITDKFSLTPNAKLSLADSKTPNLGYSAWKSPILSALAKSPLMPVYTKNSDTGEDLNYLDEVGVFNVSNPRSIVDNAAGKNRNYHFLSSVNFQYKISERFVIGTLVGLDFNNSSEVLFMPDKGIVKVDSAANSPGNLVTEYRSSQNHTYVNYSTKSKSGHSLILHGGFRYMKNSYKNNQAIDLNTPSDDFKKLGQGAQYSFLRAVTGDSRGLVWISYYGNADYNFRDKYFLSTNLSYDGNSAVNKDNRYNFYPSVAAAWRVSSEKFLSSAKWLDDLKLRGSYSVTGNMFSSVYDFSKLYYTSTRINSTGVIIREAIPNENLKMEMKTTLNGGVDLSLFKQALNLHVDVYQSNVDNLVVQQELPETFGFTNYFDNGGKIESKGIEISADTRIHLGKVIWSLGGTFAKADTKVKSLKFINPEVNNVLTQVEGAQYITSVDNSVNAFYGYKTDGIFTSEADANKYIGPKGVMMHAGDVKFVDKTPDMTINEKDKQIIGNPNAKFFGGFNTSFKYKNIELSAIFNYSVGNDLYNYVRSRTESMDSYNNQSTSVVDRWTPTNSGATMPRSAYGDPSGNNSFSDRWIEDGSYLKLKQLTLSYTLPPVSGRYKGITIYATGTNLLTLTKYTGYDPEFLYTNNPFYMGIDYGKMPQAKSFIVGLKLDL